MSITNPDNVVTKEILADFYQSILPYLGGSGGGSSGGLVQCYPVGSTPYAYDWLSMTPNGSPLTPNVSSLYLIIDDTHVISTYNDNIVRYDKNSGKYRPIIGNGLKTLFTQTKTYSTVNAINLSNIVSTVSSISGYEGTTFKINTESLTVGSQYVFNADFQLKASPSISTSYSWCFGVESSGTIDYAYPPSGTAKTNLPRNTEKTNLSLTFTAAAENYLILYLSAISMSNLPIEITNVTISEVS